MRRTPAPERLTSEARPPAAPQKCGAAAPQKCGATPPALKAPAPSSAQQDKAAAAAARTDGRTYNSREQADEARPLLAAEFPQPTAERLTHLIPPAAVRAAIRRADAQAARGFRKSRRDYIYGLLTSADFIAEALADERTTADRRARATARRAETQAERAELARQIVEDGAAVQNRREAEMAALNNAVEDMTTERMAAIVGEIIAADPSMKFHARHPGGIAAAIRRPPLRGAFLARLALIDSGQPRTIPEADA